MIRFYIINYNLLAMKKRVLGLVCFALMFGVVFSACKRENKAGNTLQVEQNLEVKKKTTIVPEFQIFKAEDSTEFCRVELSIEYPVKGEELYLDSVRNWMNNILKTDVFNWEGGNIRKFKGDLSDGQKLVNHYAAAQMKKDIDKDERDFLREMGVMYECSHNVEVSFKGENLTSVYFSTYVYTGGAHGGILNSAAIFNNKDGKQIGREIFKDTKKVKSHIIRGLMKYFEVKNKRALSECLLVSLDTLPLPVINPYFNENGLVLSYNQYEIAPYAAGMPTDIITWKECQEYLKPEIFELIKNDVDKKSTKKKK